MKGVLLKEKELNAKRHEDLLAILATLTAKLSPLLLRSPPAPTVFALLHHVSFLFLLVFAIL